MLSIIMNGISLLILWLAGSSQHRRLAWSLGLAAQVLWVAFAFVEGQPGFLLSAPVYGAIYLRNLRQERLNGHPL